MRKLIVFGPTGQTGLAVLAKSYLDAGLQVTAYLRKPEKVPEEERKRIRLIEGNVLNAEAVANAVEGQDMVISCLGTGSSLGSTTLLSEGLRNITDGMRKHGVKRIIVVGVSFLMPNEITPFPLRWIGADHKRAHEILKKSKDLEWICIAPAEIVDLPSTGTCQAAINKLHSHVVTSHDIAGWMLDCVKNAEMSQEYSHQLVGLSSTLSPLTWLTQTWAGRITIILSSIIFGGVYYFFF